MSSVKRILIVEKDEVASELLKMRLEARKYSVFCFNTSLAAVRYLDKNSVDLIIYSKEMEPVGAQPLTEVIHLKPHLTGVPLICTVSEIELHEIVMQSEKSFDDFLLKPVNPLVLQIRVELNLMNTRNRMEVNALTLLPGNQSIEKVVTKKIQSGEKFSVIYIDINNFKSYNDAYGFQRGDDVIKQTARILMSISRDLSESKRCFVGHIGGDDFIAVTSPEQEEHFARTFIQEFDRIIPTYYSEEDQKSGFVRVKNRQRKTEDFPIMSCSVAACSNADYEYQSLSEIAIDAAEVKSFLKQQNGSHYLRDRRKTQRVNLEEIANVIKKETVPKRHIDPLGKVLLAAGLINEDQLRQALQMHFETGQRLGQCLIQLGLATSQAVGQMLQKKLGVPYRSLSDVTPRKEALSFFSFEFMESHRIVPLSRDSQNLHLGMCDPFDVRLMDTIERITGLKPQPCLILEDEFEMFAESHFKDGDQAKEFAQ